MRPRGGLRLGRIFGIEIVADWSLLITFLLITVSLAGGLLPVWHPKWSPGLWWLTALSAALLFFVSVLLHELAHAWVGRAQGIEIRRITLFIFGGMATMENEPPSWRAELLMAIAGPIMSLVLGLVSAILAGIAAAPFATLDPREPARALASLGPVATLLAWLAPVNLVLGLFNLIPGFPLDGGRVLRAILWASTGDLLTATRHASRIGQACAGVLVAAGALMALGFHVPFLGSGAGSGIWLAFIGWFLHGAAGASYSQLLIRETFEDVPVARLMQTRFVTVPPQTRVGTLVDDVLMPSGQRAFPVEQDGRLLGLVCLKDLEKRGARAWYDTAVAEIMTPAERLVTVSPWQGALEALTMLGRHGKNLLPVVENGMLTGLLRREDMMAWLSLHAGAREHPQLQAAR